MWPCPRGCVGTKPLHSIDRVSTSRVNAPMKYTKRIRLRSKLDVSACRQCVQKVEQRLAGRPEPRRLIVRATKTPEQEEQAERNGLSETKQPGDSQQQQSLGVRVALSLLSFYKNGISPLLPPSCRYIPTCSAYAMEAYQEFGVGKGTVLTAWRLMRCSPFGSSGYDPVQWPPPGLGWMFKA